MSVYALMVAVVMAWFLSFHSQPNDLRALCIMDTSAMVMEGGAGDSWMNSFPFQSMCGMGADTDCIVALWDLLPCYFLLSLRSVQMKSFSLWWEAVCCSSNMVACFCSLTLALRGALGLRPTAWACSLCH